MNGLVRAIEFMPPTRIFFIHCFLPIQPRFVCLQTQVLRQTHNYTLYCREEMHPVVYCEKTAFTSCVGLGKVMVHLPLWGLENRDSWPINIKKTKHQAAWQHGETCIHVWYLIQHYFSLYCENKASVVSGWQILIITCYQTKLTNKTQGRVQFC